MMEDKEIFAEVARYPAEWVILTGGEPALWIDEDFVSALKRETGKLVAIETNGTREVPSSVDWVCVSPKFGICGGEAPLTVSHADEVKVVDTGQPLEPYFGLDCVSAETRFYLQPCFVADAEECASNRLRTVRRVLEDPRWTLSVQLHRFLGIP